MLVLHCITSVITSLAGLVIIGIGFVLGVALYLKTKPKKKY